VSKPRSLSKKLRFEVFKRDSFACQYCGAKSPEVVLVVDHIKPVAKGGTASLMNLITACQPCNAGKSDRELPDNSVVEKQREQVAALQVRREQLEMMMEWQRGLVSVDEQATKAAADFWSSLVQGWTINPSGVAGLTKLIKKHGLSDVLEAIRASTVEYLEIKDGKYTAESVAKAWDFIGRIARFRKGLQEKPYLRDVLYIRAIVRNRMIYCVDWEARNLLEEAMKSGAEFEDLKKLAQRSTNWARWRDEMELVIAELGR
jgi:hypothetical protein